MGILTMQCILVILLLFWPAQSAWGQYPPEFCEMVALIPGVYDNTEQYKNDIARGLPANERHLHLTTSLVPENIPFLSVRRNFYLEQFANGDPDNIVEQRIYSFGIDPVTLAMDLKLYGFKNPADFVHAKANDSAFLALTQANVTYDQGCDMYWYRDDGTPTRFESWMMKTCYLTFDGKKVNYEFN